MEIDLKEQPRIFKIGTQKDIEIQDWGNIILEKDEMISFKSENGKNYDVVSKDWGYYATPSMNGRLLNEGFKTALVKNKHGKFYIMIVDNKKIQSFRDYCKKESQTVTEWLDER